MLKYRANTGHYLRIKPLPVVFQPDLLWQNNFIRETLLSLKPRKTPIISLPILNPKNEPLTLFPKINLRTMQQTNIKEISVTQDFIEPSTKNSSETQN